VPPLRTVEDYFAWLAQNNEPESKTEPHE
jgi:hypothetical protein